jgi:hypothetical protein
MDANCFGVRGCASGSLLAAAVIARSSATLGICIGIFFKCLDISLHLSTVGTTKTDDPSYLFAVHEGDIEKDTGLWRERYDPLLAVVPPVVNPQERGVPVKIRGDREGEAMLLCVQPVFRWIEVESHALV